MATRRKSAPKSRKPAKKKAPAKKKTSPSQVMKDAQRMIRTGETKSMSVAMKRAWKKVK